MNRGVFITGTSTDVGKTYISSLVVKNLRENNELIPGDAKEVCTRANLNCKPKDLVSYTFKELVSPHRAAKINNEFIKLNKIKGVLNKKILIIGLFKNQFVVSDKTYEKLSKHSNKNTQNNVDQLFKNELFSISNTNRPYYLIGVDAYGEEK